MHEYIIYCQNRTKMPRHLLEQCPREGHAFYITTEADVSQLSINVSLFTSVKKLPFIFSIPKGEKMFVQDTNNKEREIICK